MMIQVYKKIFSLVSSKDKKKFGILIASMMVSSVFEMFGLAAVFPFIAVLSNPGYINTHAWMGKIYTALAFGSEHAFFMFLGGVVLSLLIISNLLAALTIWMVYRFANMQEHELSSRLLKSYLSRPYIFFTLNNPSILAKNMLSEVTSVTNQLTVPGMRFLSRLSSLIVISTFLLIFNPVLALTIIVILGGGYGALSMFTRHALKRESKLSILANSARYKLVQQAFGAIQDVKLLGLQSSVYDQYQAPSSQYAQSYVKTLSFGELPRYFVEIIAFGGVLAYLLILMSTGKNFGTVVPVLATYAYSGLRLLPTLNILYTAYTQMQFGLAKADLLLQELSSEERQPSLESEVNKPIAFHQSVEVSSLSYVYPSQTMPSLANLKLCIHRTQKIGIVGVSGSGKTTLMNILLGLMSPTSGEVRIDGQVLTPENMRTWQSQLGYVPQSIYLTDESILSNIAFGEGVGEIDIERAHAAAKIACVDHFIEGLPSGYETVIGDRGVRLSGGQRQRIGIARALYRNPKLLILDEGTSALDNLTERKVLENIVAQSQDRTIIMVAHRLSTIKSCDRIFMLGRAGKILGEGTYQTLLSNCAEFRHLAKEGPQPVFEGIV